MRPIDADAIPYKRDIVVTERFPKFGGFNGKIVYSVTKEKIDAMPTVDAVPVKRGYWIRHDWAEGCLIPNYECSVCHAWKWDESDYCPDCGALNDGKDSDNEKADLCR